MATKKVRILLLIYFRDRVGYVCFDKHGFVLDVRRRFNLLSVPVYRSRILRPKYRTRRIRWIIGCTYLARGVCSYALLSFVFMILLFV